MRLQNGYNIMVMDLSEVQFWSEIIVISNQTFFFTLFWFWNDAHDLRRNCTRLSSETILYLILNRSPRTCSGKPKRGSESRMFEDSTQEGVFNKAFEANSTEDRARDEQEMQSLGSDSSMISGHTYCEISEVGTYENANIGRQRDNPSQPPTYCNHVSPYAVSRIV